MLIVYLLSQGGWVLSFQRPCRFAGWVPGREQAIIIGDDTELVREGGDVNEVINDFREATSQILGDDDLAIQRATVEDAPLRQRQDTG
mgnify:CR=1 FL=1